MIIYYKHYLIRRYFINRNIWNIASKMTVLRSIYFRHPFAHESVVGVIYKKMRSMNWKGNEVMKRDLQPYERNKIREKLILDRK